MRIAARALQGAVIVSVSDRGLGIPREALPHVFDKFFGLGYRDAYPRRLGQQRP